VSSPEAPQDGAEIRRLRKQRGFSRKEFAARADLKEATSVTSIENERRKPSLDTLTKIAVALDVRLADIVKRGTPLHATLTHAGNGGEAA
jgi:transcriptional regulator with XRE-family HTH domain